MSSLKGICSNHITRALAQAFDTVEGSFTLDKVEGLIKTIDAIKEAVKYSFANLKKIQAAEDRLKTMVAEGQCPLFSSENEQERIASLVEYHRFLKQISEKLSSVSLDRFNPEELEEIKSRKDLLESYMAFVTKGRAVPADFSRLKVPHELTSLTVEAFSQYLEDWVQIVEAIEQKVTEDPEAVSAQSPHTGTLVKVYTAYKDVLERILQKEADPVKKNRSMLAYMPVREAVLGVIKAFSEHFDALIAESKPSHPKIDLESLGIASQSEEKIHEEGDYLEGLDLLQHPLTIVRDHARDVPSLERLAFQLPSDTKEAVLNRMAHRNREEDTLKETRIYEEMSIRHATRDKLLSMFLNHPNILRAQAITQEGPVFEKPLHDMFICISRERDPKTNTQCKHNHPVNMKHYLWGIATGLTYLHRSGIIHKNIKPENMFVFDDKLAKIGNLAGAGAAQDSLYSHTRESSAPEVNQNLQFSFASDVWSFGCIIYMILTRSTEAPSRPFFSDQDEGRLRFMDSNGLLRGIMNQCLAEEPSDRLSIDAIVDRFSNALTLKRPAKK